jgi:hypothetical protein
MEHTPTPWKEGETHFAYPLNITMFLLSGNDFQRAKACVNACAEFPDPKIDIGLLKLHVEQQTKLLASCETALAERDVTIQALQDRVKAYEAIGLDMEEKAEYFADMNRDETDKLLHETYKVLAQRFEKIRNK